MHRILISALGAISVAFLFGASERANAGEVPPEPTCFWITVEIGALSKFYGLNPQASRSFRTMAKKVDIQSQVEKAASATAGILTGPGEFVSSPR